MEEITSMSDLGTLFEIPSHVITAKSRPKPTTNLSFLPLTGNIKDTKGASVNKKK